MRSVELPKLWRILLLHGRRAGCRLHVLEEWLHNSVHGHAFSFGAVVDQDAMAQHRISERLNVVLRHMSAAIEKRPRLGAEDHELSGSKACTPTDPFIDEVRHALLARPGCGSD